MNIFQVSAYFGYGATRDSVYSVALRPNPTCADSWCLKRQTERRVQLVSRGLPENAEWDAEARLEAHLEADKLKAEEASRPVHEENEFQIQLIASDSAATNSTPISPLQSTQFPTTGDVNAEEKPTAGQEQSLEELMKKLQGLH